MRNFDVIVIGGCASGLVAAINAKRLHKNLNIAVLEKLPRIGKKILATGNGRCNLTNMNASVHPYHNAEFADFALNEYPPEKVIDFFSTLGMLTKCDDEGRVYPRSNVASSVLDALRFEIEKQNINVFCNVGITKIKRTKNRFIINDEFSADKIIVACGGKSSPSQGSDGSIFDAVKSLGHSFTELYPALAPLVCVNSDMKALKGLRASGIEITSRCNGKEIGKSRGEILFTDNGISGIAAMELSAELNSYVKEKTFTDIDFLPEMAEEQLGEYIRSARNIKGNLIIDELLTGILPKMIGVCICKAIELYRSDKRISEITDSECDRIAKAIKKFSVPVNGAKDFKNSQVTRGGIKTNEISPETLQSRICEGLYFAGEIIDVDGGCGGFNLQWAWASGLLAGELK